MGYPETFDLVIITQGCKFFHIPPPMGGIILAEGKLFKSTKRWEKKAKRKKEGEKKEKKKR